MAIILVLKVATLWAVVDLALALALGALIRKGERARTDEFLTAVFAVLSRRQATQL